MPSNNMSGISTMAKAVINNSHVQKQFQSRFTESDLRPDNRAHQNQNNFYSNNNPNGNWVETTVQSTADSGFAYGKKTATAPLRVYENIPRLVVRGLQFLLGIVIVGIYGERVRKGREDPEAASAAWVFGLIVSVAACFTALVFAVVAPLGAVARRFKTHRLFGWDLTLFVLWITTFGVFAQIFLHRDDDASSYKGASTTIEKGAMWLDLANSLLWLVSGVYGSLKVFLGNKVDSVGGKVTGKVTGKATGGLFGKKNKKGAEQHDDDKVREMHEQWADDDAEATTYSHYHQHQHSPSHTSNYAV